jgi:hypothetical protein
MLSIGKRAVGIGAAVAMIATAAPVAAASASTGPAAATPSMVAPVGPYSGAFQAGATAAIGGWNAGADAAVGGLNAGAAALGLPFSLKLNTSGPLGLHVGTLSGLNTSATLAPLGLGNGGLGLNLAP